MNARRIFVRVNGSGSTGTVAITYGGTTIATYTNSTASTTQVVDIEYELHFISATKANIYYQNRGASAFVAGVLSANATIADITSSQTLNATISVTNGTTSYYSSEMFKYN